jgi:deoxyuridine 5'-triphosphate nucleotidohydrolase
MNNEVSLKVKLLNENAKLPEKSYDSENQLGYDIFTINDYILYPGNSVIIETGIAVEPPIGFGLEIRNRSGLSTKGITYLGGEIDNSYRGEIKVIMINLSNTRYDIHKGDKIAQLLPRKIYNFKVEEVKELSETVRGDKGFGSSGK